MQFNIRRDFHHSKYSLSLWFYCVSQKKSYTIWYLALSYYAGISKGFLFHVNDPHFLPAEE